MTYGGKEFTEKRALAARNRFSSIRDIFAFGASMVLIVLGALLLAEGVIGSVNGTMLFFEGVNRGFEFIMGLVTVIVGASMMPSQKPPHIA